MKIFKIGFYLFTYFVLSKAGIDKYVIKSNDTCYDIIQKYNIYNKTFYEINPLINCSNLLPGNNINLFNNDTLIISKKDFNEYVNERCKK